MESFFIGFVFYGGIGLFLGNITDAPRLLHRSGWFGTVMAAGADQRAFGSCLGFRTIPNGAQRPGGFAGAGGTGAPGETGSASFSVANASRTFASEAIFRP
jgi:hypothetical protein